VTLHIFFVIFTALAAHINGLIYYTVADERNSRGRLVLVQANFLG